MKKSLKTTLGAFSTVAGGVLMAMPAMAANGSSVKDYISTSQTGVNADGSTVSSTVNTVINVAIGIIGLLAVIMIIIGGFQYTTSAGDSGKVTKAKNTIMYGVIGLVIALLAYAIVNFVLKNVFNIS